MSTERIQELHEQASECYLSGDYQGALDAWRNVLGLDPADEQALAGLRLASQFVERAAPVTTEDDVEHELDLGLQVLDGLSVATVPPPNTADWATDRRPEPEGAREIQHEEFLEGWETSGSSSGPDACGLEPMSHGAPAPAVPVSAAAAELARRVDDLLTDAKAKAEAGERDEALAILARLSILDEDNAAAAILRSRIEAEGASDLDKVEQAIIEGVSALEADRLDDAERFFREALSLAPEHREAQHYLEKVEERRGGVSEELLAPVSHEAAPDDDAVPRAFAVESTSNRTPPGLVPPRPAATPLDAAPEPALEVAAPRAALPQPKFLIWAGVSVLVLAVAAFALPRLFGGSAPNASAAVSSRPGPRPGRATKSGAAPNAGASSPAQVAPTNPEQAAKAVTSGLARARELASTGDFGGAVIAYNAVLNIDPKNVEAKSGLEEAGERYKASRAEREAVANIKLAFRDGEFRSALRLAYRLPPGVSPSFADAVKFAGWYNLAVVALRAGECREAISHLDEVLQIEPADADARKLREFATRYADAVKDRAFLDHVEALAFRPLPVS